MVLTVAGIVVKILGGVNRILLSRLLGGEGIGLYQMAYPMYILLLSIVGAGIPIAVSIMVAEQAARGNYSGTRRIFHTGFYGRHRSFVRPWHGTGSPGTYCYGTCQ